MPSSCCHCYFGRNATTTKHLRRSVTVRLIDGVRLIAAITTFRLEFHSWHRRENQKKSGEEKIKNEPRVSSAQSSLVSIKYVITSWDGES